MDCGGTVATGREEEDDAGPVADEELAGYDEDDLERRPDMQQAKQSLKIMRALCKEYGIGFRMPEGSTFGGFGRRPGGDKRRARLRSQSGTAGEEGESAGSSSSSSFEFSSEEEKEPPASWSQVRAMLESLQTDDRVSALQEIDAELQPRSVKAKVQLRELAVLEHHNAKVDRRRERAETVDSAAASDVGAASDSGSDEIDESLLRFRAEEMPIAKALKRCIAVVPVLRHQALMKEDERRKDAEFRAKEEERRRIENELALEALENDMTIRGEVERKLRSLGDLPADADPDLIKVLEEQRAEARRLVQQIQASEHDAMILKLAVDYVDGKLNYEGLDIRHIEETIKFATDLKAKKLAQRQAESEIKLRAERETQDIPTEEEVLVAVQVQSALQKEVERMADHVRRMQERTADGDPNQHASNRKRRAMPAADVALPVPLDKVQEAHPQLLKECADLDKSIQQEEADMKTSEVLLKNAEKTLKVIEECKILFLEQVALERPAVIKELLEADAKRDADADAGSKASLDSSDEEADKNKEEDKDNAALLALGIEERWLRIQLAQFLPEEGGDDPAAGAADAAAVAEESDDGGHPFDEVAQDIRKLTKHLEVEYAKCTGQAAPAEAQEIQEEDLEYLESPEWKAVEALSPAEAAEQLRKMPFDEVRGILRLQAENKDLERRIQEAKAEIERIRYEQGATKAVLGELGAEPPPGRVVLPKAVKVDQKLVEEVQTKVKLLRAMRLRWWKERQDPSTTVRRALAAVGLPEGDEEDQPPTRVQATLFERIYETMTMP